MTTHARETSPQTYARIGGALYLLIIVAGLFGELFVRSNLIVSDDPTATANNIMASQLLWRIGITGDLIMHVCDVPLMMIFYVLLKPVNKNLALLAVFFNLISSAVLIAYKLNLLEALFLLGSADYLKVFEPHQLHALAYLAIKADGYGFGIGLIFFGFACLVYGYLIFRSGYFLKTLGVLMTIAGLSYLTNSLTLILAPTYSAMIFPILALAFIGETSFCLWLIVKGVNVPKWEKRALESA
jgi:Domain of unknown function (DUF4386)